VRSANSYIEAFNGLFQAVNLRARGFTGMATIKTGIFLIAGKLNSARSILMPGNPLDFRRNALPVVTARFAAHMHTARWKVQWHGAVAPLGDTVHH
jgi:hypothetical protein